MFMNGAETKICPHCAETIKAAAKVCPQCRYWQKKWSWHNPLLVLLTIMVVLLGLMGVFVDRMLGPKEEFATYRDEISVVSSESSHRISGSNQWVTVVGMLTNKSNVGWKEVSVEARFMDKSGKLIDVIPAQADSYREATLLPHGEAAFKVEGRAARPESEYDNYKVSVRWAKDVDATF
jgi:hypothetical protein